LVEASEPTLQKEPLMPATEPDCNAQPRGTLSFTDLGKYIISVSGDKKVAFVYPGWQMNILFAHSENHYSTNTMLWLDGQWLYGTFDFNDDVLNKFLRHASASSIKAIGDGLMSGSAVNGTHLPDAIRVGIYAVVGKEECGPDGLFVPLNISDVFIGSGA